MHQLLQCLPPELAHKIALTAAAHGLVPDQRKPERCATLFGRNIHSLVGLAAGADKNGVAIAGWQKMGLGFVELGTVTYRPRAGNPSPRLWRYPAKHAIVNFMGLPNDGHQALLQRLKKFRQQEQVQDVHPLNRFCIGVSLSMLNASLDELGEMTRTLTPHVDFFTLNVSCPNVVGHRNLQDALAANLAQIKVVRENARQRHQPSKKVLIKLGPTRDLDTLNDMAKLMLVAGAAGFVATNTVPADQAHLLQGATSLVWNQGGYSGPALADIGIGMIRALRQSTGPKIMLIGTGGIQSPQTAMDYIDNGANLTQLYTGLTYKGPRLIKEINQMPRL